MIDSRMMQDELRRVAQEKLAADMLAASGGAVPRVRTRTPKYKARARADKRVAPTPRARRTPATPPAPTPTRLSMRRTAPTPAVPRVSDTKKQPGLAPRYVPSRARSTTSAAAKRRRSLATAMLSDRMPTSSQARP